MGPVRVKEQLTVREDLYSYLFISCLHADYIHELKLKDEKEQEVRDQAVEDFKEQESAEEKKEAEDNKQAKKGLAALLLPSLTAEIEEEVATLDEEEEVDPDKISDSDCELDFHEAKKEELEKEMNKDIEGLDNEEKIKKLKEDEEK